MVRYDEANKWLVVEDADGAPDLDPLAFPVTPVDETLLHARQRECGASPVADDDGFEHQERLLDAIDAAKATLGS